MPLAIALLANRSPSFSLYAEALNGTSVEDLAVAYRLPVHSVRERIDATQMALRHQVVLSFVALK
jgi:hypothetical protein